MTIRQMPQVLHDTKTGQKLSAKNSPQTKIQFSIRLVIGGHHLVTFLNSKRVQTAKEISAFYISANSRETIP